jgi:hypothetical protein
VSSGIGYPGDRKEIGRGRPPAGVSNSAFSSASACGQRPCVLSPFPSLRSCARDAAAGPASSSVVRIAGMGLWVDGQDDSVRLCGPEAKQLVPAPPRSTLPLPALGQPHAFDDALALRQNRGVALDPGAEALDRETRIDCKVGLHLPVLPSSRSRSSDTRPETGMKAKRNGV